MVGEIFKKTRALLGNHILEQFSIIENKKIEKKTFGNQKTKLCF